jgi:DNA-binding transcriptional MocR family regulator
MAADRETIDLSLSSPGDLSHLPPVQPAQAWASLDGHGLDPAGLPQLRRQLASHLSEHLSLPTTEDQLVITDGAQEALWLLTRVLPARVILASCPTYPGLTRAAGGSRATVTPVPGDLAGPDPGAIARHGKAPGAIAFLMPTGHNPAGSVMPAVRRHSLARIADAGNVTIVEDLALADLALGPLAPGEVPPPLSVLSPAVIAIGSTAKLLWGGLRVGWIRVADEPLRSALTGRKSALNLATSAISQAIAAQLLAALTPDWLAAHRAALTERRDYLAALLAAHLPAWTVQSPRAGLSLWAELPVSSADAFTHAAARHGVAVAPGALACLDGRHHNYVRLSFAERPGTLELAAERLAAAWASHAADLAVAPMAPAGAAPVTRQP